MIMRRRPLDPPRAVERTVAREMMHAFQWQRGVEDPDHLRPEWSLVAAANDALAQAGL
jgi:hypothetical protein